MAIRKSFNGQQILKPGPYSKFKVDNSAGSDLGANNTLFLLGESSKGAPGSESGIVEFSASRLDSLIATYGDGPLVDAAIAAVRPSVTPGIGGAGKIQIWKTNASTQASAALSRGGSDLFQVKDKGWGSEGNSLSVVVAAGSSGNQRLISVTQLGGTTESLGENVAQQILSIEYTGDATTAVMAIAGASRNALTLTTTLAGDQTDGSVNLSVALNTKTMKQLVDFINAQVGYAAVLIAPSRSQSAATELDPKSSTSILVALPLYRIQLELLELLNTSDRIEATEDDVVGGVPDTGTEALSGGVQGASVNSDFSTGLSQSLAEDYNVALACISRDASVDILDDELGFTDAASTYTIASVLAAVSAHLALRGNTKNRKEAQGMGGFRDADKDDCFSAISTVNDANMQIAMQDVIFTDAQGSLKVGQPHVFAALCAGIRLGTAIGEPMTNKFLRANFVGHFIDPVTGLEEGDFNAGLDADEAIENGVLFAEKKGAGFRVVVDNTTYGQDESFVYNRGSVIEASYFVFKTLRQVAEDIFIGNKVSNGLASSIKNSVRNKLRELNQPDVQIITSSDDAPEGFREDTFVVTVEGNTARVQVEFKPVQGLDFVFFDFTLGDIQQSA